MRASRRLTNLTYALLTRPGPTMQAQLAFAGQGLAPRRSGLLSGLLIKPRGVSGALVSTSAGLTPGGSGSAFFTRPPGLPHRAAAASADSAGPPSSSPNLPPPLTVTHLPPSASPPSAADLASAFATAGFSVVKMLNLGADHALSAHAVPSPRLLGVASGHFLISVDPNDPAEVNGDEEEEEGEGGPGPHTEALQLSQGTFLLMPAGVRHSAYVTGGAPVVLVMGSRPGEGDE
jgi:hypothetical protein